MSDPVAPHVSVSQADLQVAFAEWEAQARAGNWTRDPSATVEQVAAWNAEEFFARLQRITAPATAAA